jgi:hypothetical protein
MEDNMLPGLQSIVVMILGWICLTAFFVLIDTLFPKNVQDCKEIAEDSLGRSFWLGLINGIFLLALTLLFMYLGENSKIPLLFLPGLFFVILFIIGGIIGLSSMFQLIGDRLFPDQSLFKKRSYSAGASILACLAPFVGWYVLLPYLILVGLGAFVIRTYNQYQASRVKVEN